MIRKILVILGGIITSGLSVLVAYFLTLIIGDYFYKNFIGPCKDDRPVSLIPLFAMAVVNGLIFVFVLWRRREATKRIIIIFTSVTLIMPISFFNWAFCDRLYGFPTQLALNVVLLFLGLLAALHVRRLRRSSDEAKVARWLALTLLYFGAIFVPALYTIAWFAFQAGIRFPQEGILDSIAGVISAIVAVFDYIHTRRQASAAA